MLWNAILFILQISIAYYRILPYTIKYYLAPQNTTLYYCILFGTVEYDLESEYMIWWQVALKDSICIILFVWIIVCTAEHYFVLQALLYYRSLLALQNRVLCHSNPGVALEQSWSSPGAVQGQPRAAQEQLGKHSCVFSLKRFLSVS